MADNKKARKFIDGAPSAIKTPPKPAPKPSNQSGQNQGNQNNSKK